LLCRAPCAPSCSTGFSLCSCFSLLCYLCAPTSA
jgi:hypothetical protein